MSVDPSQTAAHVRGRLAARRLEAEARAEEARRIARGLAARLVAEFGAARVFLYGSLARGPVHGRSDVDLAVEGLDAERLARAAAALDEAAAPFTLDLVALDRLPARWRESVERDGVRLG